jgi:hypothetical protein
MTIRSRSLEMLFLTQTEGKKYDGKILQLIQYFNVQGGIAVPVGKENNLKMLFFFFHVFYSFSSFRFQLRAFISLACFTRRRPVRHDLGHHQ